MSIPVEAATAMFSPQPIRPVPVLAQQDQTKTGHKRQSSLDKARCGEYFRQNSSPIVMSDFFEGWPSFWSLTTYGGNNDKDTSQQEEQQRQQEQQKQHQQLLLQRDHSRSVTLADLDRPSHPPPTRRWSTHTSIDSSTSSNPTVSDSPSHPLAETSDDGDEDDFADYETAPSGSPRRDSVHVGQHINDLLSQEKVKQATVALRQAVNTLNITDLNPSHNQENVAKTYSTMMLNLCDPSIASVINSISQVDIDKHPDQIYHSIVWRLFAKVVEAGYVLEYDAYLGMVNYLMDHHCQSVALQALYTMPRPMWDTQVYKIAVALHMMQSPKQIQQAELLLAEFGKPFIEVANPLAPTELPPIRIDTPKMANVTEQDRFKLWMVYQNAMSDTEWAREKTLYESRRHDSNRERRKHRRNSSVLVDWALRRMSIPTEEQRLEHCKIDDDNAMIYTAILNKQYEYAWQIYLKMGDSIDEFTPRVTMQLCWRAFSDTPIMTHVARRAEWENRAWDLYGRFFFSEYLHPDQPEARGFLSDLLCLSAFSPEKRERARFTKTMSVYHLLERLKLHSLLCDDQILAPILCMLLLECKGAPAHILRVCHTALDVWSKKENDANQVTGEIILWALLVICHKAGDVAAFRRALKPALDITMPSCSLLAIIQTFHDRHLQCQEDKQCYFHKYLFRPVPHTDDAKDEAMDPTTVPGRAVAADEPTRMDGFGFVSQEMVTPPRRNSTAGGAAGPIAYVDHALHKRTDIHEPLAPQVAMAAAMGAAREDSLPDDPSNQQFMYVTPAKARALVRHTWDIAGRRSSQ